MQQRTELIETLLLELKGLPETIRPEQPVTLSRKSLITLLGSVHEMSQVLDDMAEDEMEELRILWDEEEPDSGPSPEETGVD